MFGICRRLGFWRVSCVSVGVLLKLVWGSKANWGCCVCRFGKTGSGCEHIALAYCWCVVSKLTGICFFWLCVVWMSQFGLGRGARVCGLFGLLLLVLGGLFSFFLADLVCLRVVLLRSSRRAGSKRL
ncbi:putative cob(I)alamin adenosyltransferase [Candidatus Hodgkinia cicadicola]|nr:putative cob(I)alamin adenosyltransferase [Candidatus Hodgkinia cicadicola]